MAKDRKTPERVAVEAMTMAIGALKMSDAKNADFVVAALQDAIDAFDPRCDHEWNTALSPHGGLQAECRKCHVVRYTQ